MEEDFNGRQLQNKTDSMEWKTTHWNKTSLEYNPNGRQPQYMMTYMANNIIGIQPQWKKISMEDKINERRHHWKITSMQDDLNGRQA